MSGRRVSWTPGNPQLKLPVVLPSEIRSRGRVRLPAELLDKVSWLADAKDSRLEIVLEVRDLGHVRIVPKPLIDALLASEKELLPSLVRRLFASHIEDDGRLVLPSIFEDRIFANWSGPTEQNVVLECHNDHVAILTTDAWVKLVGTERPLEQLLSKYSE